jgi:DNA helicase-2/ATP-dependent DNA helicase PcrA
MYVLDEIKLHHRNGIALRDMAVLYRNNSLSSIIEDALVHASLPYQVLKGFNFFERAEIKDVIAYIRILVNPNDEIGFKRAVGVPSRGVGATTIKQIIDDRIRNGGHIFDAIQRCLSNGLIKGKARGSLQDFHDTFVGSELWNAPTLKDQLEWLLVKTGFMDYLSGLKEGEDADRLQNVQQLLASIEVYQRDRESASWVDYLEDVKLVYESPASSKESDGSVDAVNLSTIHGVKGLEFSVVFVIGSDEEVFFARAKTAAELEEERRLYYVALTRARSQLYITHTVKRNIYGAFVKSHMCRFVEELPCNTLTVAW